MAGVLIYTAAPDSEGTLGGLVSLGKPEVLERHLNQALDSMRLCSSDPLCAEHHAGKEGTSLHGASCHACLFAPETSCERGNKYLDRSVLVPSVDQSLYSFFDPPDSDDTNPGEEDDAGDGVSQSTNDAIDLYDLITADVTEATAKIKLPTSIQKALKLKSPTVDFRFLGDGDAMPKKNTIVIVKNDGLESGSEKVKLACGKMLWSKQKSVDSGESTVLISIKGKDTVKLRLSASDWESFRPLAVINE